MAGADCFGARQQPAPAHCRAAHRADPRAHWQLRRADDMRTVHAGITGTRASTSPGNISSTCTTGMGVSPLTAFELDLCDRVRTLSQAPLLMEDAKVALAQIQRQRALDENTLLLLSKALPADLLMRRPDVRQAEQVLIAHHANIGAARAAFFPKVTLTGCTSFAGNDLRRLFSTGAHA